MARVDDAVRDLVLYHSKRMAKEVLGDLPSQMRDVRRDVRQLQKAVEELIKQVGGLLEAKREEAPVAPAAEEEVEKARFTKRTLPALRKRLGLTQRELAQLLEVSSVTIGSWERGKTRPTGGNLAKVIALRSMSPEQVDTALGRKSVSTPMEPGQIKALRVRLGLTQADLAKLADVSPGAVTAWETGKSSPRGTNREALAAIGDMTPEEVNERLGREGPAAPGTAVATSAALTPEGIKRIRREAGLSQKGMAEALGVSANSVSNWETGRATPRRDSVAKLLSMGE